MHPSVFATHLRIASGILSIINDQVARKACRIAEKSFRFSMISTEQAFLEAFAKIRGTGHFHSHGSHPFFLPRLHVEGVDEVAFPLQTYQAKLLIEKAEIAPYGQGHQTILNEKVRKCWQIDASEFSFKSPDWEKFLTTILGKIQDDLGIQGVISAHPYKLLIYGKGGHFKAHRDTEKLDSMFGSLIIALPSKHDGGQLLIRHEGREIEVDFSHTEHLHQFQYAAFFADCEHQVEPVRSGYRCCLAYNLRLDEGAADELNQALDQQAKSLIPSLTRLQQESPQKLTAILLEHSYTETNLSISKLKGNDVAKAKALFAAAKEIGYTAHIALVTYHQMGELEESSRSYNRYRHDDDYDEDEDGTMGEIFDEYIHIDHWRDDHDRMAAMGAFKIEKDAILSEREFGEGEPDEQEAEGYTGNAGCTMDYWYRSAAIVLWSHDDHENILCGYNFAGACKTLKLLSEDLDTGVGSAFHRLAVAIIARYPEALPKYRPISNSDELPLGITVSALANAKSLDLFKSLQEKILPTAIGDFSSTLWASLDQAFGVDACSTSYAALLSDPIKNRLALFQILDTIHDKTDCATWARRIVTILSKQFTNQLEQVSTLLAASHLIQSKKDQATAIRNLVADASSGYIRIILGPALTDPRLKKKFTPDHSIRHRVLVAVKGRLTQEIEKPLSPFPNWSRPHPTIEVLLENQKSDSHPNSPLPTEILNELIDFMANPDASTLIFKKNGNVRDSITDLIRKHRLDLDQTTLRKGTPHQLICTKNDASYMIACVEKKIDEKLLNQLQSL
jgi:2OG-Fe(II) oxygenase superfamily